MAPEITQRNTCPGSYVPLDPWSDKSYLSYFHYYSQRGVFME